jgi:hypothetical protein
MTQMDVNIIKHSLSPNAQSSGLKNLMPLPYAGICVKKDSLTQEKEEER